MSDLTEKLAEQHETIVRQVILELEQIKKLEEVKKEKAQLEKKILKWLKENIPQKAKSHE